MIEEQEVTARELEEARMDLAIRLDPPADETSESALTTPIQTAKENPRLEFREGQFVFCMTNEAGGKVERFISAEQVKHAFTGLPIDTGWMAPGIMRWGNGRLGEWAVGFVPPRVHEIEITREAELQAYVTFGDRTEPAGTVPAVEHSRIRVPLPGLVWFGHGTTYFIWAVRTETLNPHFEIYRAPLPNTYATGEICWGGVKPERMTAASLFKAYDLFMGSTFNNHLANAKSKREPQDVRIVLRDLAVQPYDEKAVAFDVDHCPPIYPVEDLVRQVPQTGVTLDQAIKNYFEMGEMPS